jgi:hypothetical protein
MTRKHLILAAFAVTALALPSQAAEKSGSAVAAAPGGLRGTVVCRGGGTNVPVTADAEQAIPLHIVARLNCGDEVSVVSDSEGYTLMVHTADGKDGYVARMYLTELRAAAANARPNEAVVDNGIARWQSGAPGSDQFFSGGSVVESLTANGITVQVSLQDTDWKLRANVAIANQSTEEVHFDPAAFTLDELKPRLRALAYQNPRELAKAMTHQVYWTNVSAVAPPSAVYMNAVYKTSAYVPATPNYLAQEAQPIQASVLDARTLAPKEKASGVVWFERDRNPQQLTLRVFVNDQIFEFPLSFPQHN